jgi:integrase/recombinase XerD
MPLILQTLTGAIVEYIENVTRQKSRSSQSQEPIYFRDFEQYLIKNKIFLFHDLTPKHMEFFQSSLLKKKKPQTVNRQFTVYKHFFRKCQEWNYVDLSPARFIRRKKEIEPHRDLWEKSQFRMVLKLCPRWFRNILRFLRHTGIRPQELGLIQKKHCFLKDDYLIIEMPKTKEWRAIALNMTARRVLLIELDKCRQRTDFVFTNESGRPITTNRINQKLKLITKRHGIHTLTAYSLRHGYATNLVKKNVNLAKVQKAMGHKKISTTLKYTHLNIEDLKDLAKIRY